MKKVIIGIVCSFMLMPLVATSTKVTHIDRKIYVKDDTQIVLDALTVYNPSKSQCDKTPFITASNSRINPEDLKKQNIRWMALSRDLLKRWKGDFHYGDTVLVTSGDPQIDGLWIIKDTMNRRYKKRGDLLFDTTVRKVGKWSNVEISKVNWLTV